MQRATVVFSDDFAVGLAALGRDPGLPVDGGPLIEATPRQLLAVHGYLAPFRPLKITSVEHNGEETNAGFSHGAW